MKRTMAAMIVLLLLANVSLAFDLNAKKAFVCDLDGTLFIGAEPIRPAVEFVIANTKSGRFRVLLFDKQHIEDASGLPEEARKSRNPG